MAAAQEVPEKHFVLNSDMKPANPNLGSAVFATGYNLSISLVNSLFSCFWGAEKSFWRMPGVYTYVQTANM